MLRYKAPIAISVMLASGVFLTVNHSSSLQVKFLNQISTESSADRLNSFSQYPVKIVFSSRESLQGHKYGLAHESCTECKGASGVVMASVAGSAAPDDTDSRNAVPAMNAISRRDFESAFRGFGSARPNASANVAIDRQKGFIPSDFSLDRINSNRDVIEIRKPVRFRGKAAASASLRIIGDTTVLVKSSDIAGFIPEGPSRARIARIADKSNAGGYVDFDALRDAGIDVRYDAIHDQIVIAPDES